MNRRQCPETFAGDRCMKPENHPDHHAGAVLAWDRALVRMPTWLVRGQFRRWTPA